MSNSRLISGRVKKVNGNLLDSNRQKFLSLSNAEPDLDNPLVSGQLLSSTNTGTRYWTSTLTDITLVNSTVTGNIYVSGDVYSQGGQPLYTPRVTISNVAPNDPRVGDFWIDTENGVEFQYVKDGENLFWIQFTGI